jgi:hypothetical protein
MAEKRIIGNVEEDEFTREGNSEVRGGHGGGKKERTLFVRLSFTN